MNTTTDLLCYKNVASHLVKKFAIRTPFTRNSPPLYIRKHEIEACNESTTLYEESTGLCHNVLVSLKYEFTWNGSNITEVNSMFVLASIPTSEDDEARLYVTRQFEVTFEHAVKTYDLNSSFEDDIVQVRSGKPGYKSGKPLIMGTLSW